MDESTAKSLQAWVQAQDLGLCTPQKNSAVFETAVRGKIAEASALSPVPHDLLAELHALQARAESDQGKLAEATLSLTAAEKHIAELGGEVPPRVQIRLLLEDGRLLILNKTPSQARMRFSQAWALSVNAGEDFFTVDLARMMAEIEPAKLQETWIQKAIEIAEDSKQEKARLWLGGLYADLGWRYFDHHLYEDSLLSHQKSLARFQKQGFSHEIFMAKWCVARTLRQLGRYEDALTILEAIYPANDESDAAVGRLCEELGECLLALKKPEAAQPYFAKAHSKLSGEGRTPDRHPLRLKRLKDLGRVD